jgi:hypothetical protein
VFQAREEEEQKRQHDSNPSQFPNAPIQIKPSSSDNNGGFKYSPKSKSESGADHDFRAIAEFPKTMIYPKLGPMLRF